MPRADPLTASKLLAMGSAAYVLLFCIVAAGAKGTALAPLNVAREKEDRERLAARLCSRLRGYEWFNREFSFDKRSTTVGHVNGFDESLFVQLAARRHRLIDAARWWNPLGRDRQPQYDWHDLRRAYDDASREVARHRWSRRGSDSTQAGLWRFKYSERRSAKQSLS